MHHFSIANDLLLFGADINFKRQDGTTALHDCVLRCDVEGLNFLLSQPSSVGLMCNMQDHMGDSPFLKAASKNSIELIKLLLEKKRDSINTMIHNLNGWNIFHICAQRGCVDVLKFIQSSKIYTHEQLTNLINQSDNMYKKRCPIHFATERRQVAALKLLVEMGCDINATDAYGNTALHLALNSDSSDIIEYLLSKGAKTNIKNNYKETVRSLLKKRRSLKM